MKNFRILKITWFSIPITNCYSIVNLLELNRIHVGLLDMNTAKMLYTC
jgi:hypothetical protein